MPVYPTWQNNSPFEDICLYTCHFFQHYLVINFEVIDPYIKRAAVFWPFNNFLNKILKHLTYI